MSDIFISYASEDREQAQQLAEALARQDWSVWWDRAIPTGKRFHQVIDEALSGARCVVVLWSRISVERDWVLEEAEDGKERGILIPILIDGIPLPRGFRRIQAANLVGWDGEESSRPFRKLLTDIEAILGPHPSADDLKQPKPGAPPPEQPGRASADSEERVGTTLRQEAQSTPKQTLAQATPDRKGERPKRQWFTADKRLVGTAALVGTVSMVIAIAAVLMFRSPAQDEQLSSGVEGGGAESASTKREATLPEQAEGPPTDIAQLAMKRNGKIERPSEEQVKRLAEEQVRRAEEERKGRDATRQQAALDEKRRKEQQTQEEIRRLLADAEQAIASLRLTSPSGKNALEFYQQVLEREPANAEAKQGMKRIVSRYLELAESSAAKWDYDAARTYLDRAELVEPGAEAVPLARKRLDAALKKQGPVFRDALSDGSKGPEMVEIPAGTFLMGSQAGEKGHTTLEAPQHRVTIGRAFAMGRYEVTFAEYDRFTQATNRGFRKDQGWGRGTRPVIHVSWDDAIAYTKWLSAATGKRYRLPSEAEWEYAARGGTQTAYWWGNEMGRNRANCNGCGSQWDGKQTAPVGSFKPNPFELYDTAGNVWELVKDCIWAWSYHNYNGAPEDGSALEKRNWLGICMPVYRGGGWEMSPLGVRSAVRGFARHGGTPPTRKYKAHWLGFRVARDLD